MKVGHCQAFNTKYPVLNQAWVFFYLHIDNELCQNDIFVLNKNEQRRGPKGEVRDALDQNSGGFLHTKG